MANKAEIYKHGVKLAAVFGEFGENMPPVELAAKLYRLETTGHRLAEDYSNGYLDTDDYEQKTDSLLKTVDKLTGYKAKGIPVFFDGDPRGYALKIDDEYMRTHNIDLPRDWGGNGILAP